MRYCFLFICMIIYTTSSAQNIYGSSSGQFRQFSIHNFGDSVIIPSVLFTQDGSSLGNESTADIKKNIYYYLGRPNVIFADSNVIHKVDVLKKTIVLDTIGGDSIRHIEYCNDTLWGLYDNGISCYDIKTGKLIIYDSIADGSEKGREFFRNVICTAFDSENIVYMFTKRGQWTGLMPDTFLYYDIRSKVLVKNVIPGGFLYFDYLPKDKTVYMPYNGLRAADRTNDSASGVYAYDLYSNKMKLHVKVDAKAWRNTRQFWEITTDPIRNRMFFILTGANNSRDTIAMLRINNKRFEVYKVPNSKSWTEIEFLDTYNDTTRDSKLGVKDTYLRDIELSCYPNPSTGKLFINTGAEVVKLVEVYNLSGKLVFKSNYMINKGIVELDIHNMLDGQYLLKVQTNSGNASTAFKLIQ